MDDESLEPKLRVIARKVRLFLEPHWWCWRMYEGRPEDRRLSQATCDRSSLFLVAVLTDQGLPARLAMGTPVKGPYGYCANGSWRGHAWVESAGHIIDLTADQFGGPEIRICPVNDPRYAEGEDMAEAEVILRREETAQRLLARWRAAGGMAAPETAFAPLTEEDLRRLCED
ncbi:hypothetical protein [Acidimangrovimonas pyrenivorans]|uniref:Transglutaminase-like domain-containing protein n=1 Tax=Acidimangrovimonas pyrenivorans TaxID=2030798 RepID=A0ABV7AI92_9RHOB